MGSDSGSLPGGLIVNADDLGIHPNINEGILSAYRRGILTSCTMLFTTPYLEQTIRDFVRPASLPIGIHLSLTLGKPVAPARDIPDLLDEHGDLGLAAGKIICASANGIKPLLPQIRRELDCQLSLAIDSGLRPTHADSHQHVHMHPAIFRICEELLPRYGIRRLRYCREPLLNFTSGLDSAAVLKRLNLLKWAVLQWRARQIRPTLTTNGDFYGVLHSGAMTKRALARAVSRAPTQRCTEICVHPGFPAPAGEQAYTRDNYNSFISVPERKIEYDAVVDAEISSIVRKRGLALRAFDGSLKT